MRVGLNLLYFIPEQGGVETFGRELVRALCETAVDGEELVLFTSLDGQEFKEYQCSQVKVVVCPFHARHRGVRYIWEQLVLPWQAVAHGVDLLHSLAYVGPVLSFVPTILTIHDANTRAVKMKALRRLVLWNVSLWAAHRARLVTTVSRFSRGEVLKWYGLPESRLKVVISGPGTSPEPESVPVDHRGLIRALGIQEPYIAVIGGTYPHKNIRRAVESFQRIANQIPHRLVIIGKIPSEVRTVVDRLTTQRIIVTGYLPSRVMRTVISQSDLFVMPSLYEGFGFPVLEAQAQGVPVACSNAGSLPEVVRDSAALFDPESIQDIAGTMARCLTDRERNLELGSRARGNAASYSWKTAAAAYRACYQNVAAGTVTIATRGL